MERNTLLEIIDAAHLTKYVQSPFKQRGGIMLVGPPENLKTTAITTALDEYYDAVITGDINTPTLVKLRDDIRTGRYSTLAFTEFEKLYMRKDSVSANLEGNLKALVEEGFTRASFEDSRLQMTESRALVIGGLTQSFYNKMFPEWKENGFARRFLWCNYSITNSWRLQDAVSEWKPLDLGILVFRKPGNKTIPYTITPEEDLVLRKAVKEQPGSITPFVLLKKIMCVLKWKYEKKDPKHPMKIIKDFAECLRLRGAEMTL